MVVSDDLSSARGSAQANRGALCSADGKIRLEAMNEVIHYHFVYVSREEIFVYFCACLAELTYRRMVFQQPGRENLSKIIISIHRIKGSFGCVAGSNKITTKSNME